VAVDHVVTISSSVRPAATAGIWLRRSLAARRSVASAGSGRQATQLLGELHPCADRIISVGSFGRARGRQQRAERNEHDELGAAAVCFCSSRTGGTIFFQRSL
jgi:hypothetical protein